LSQRFLELLALKTNKMKNFLKYIWMVIPLFLVGKYLWKMPKYNPGKLAPEFSIPALDGATLNLSDYKGKMLLLDFWGSWCGPCRLESPNLVKVYNDYGGKGFEILSVALDKSEARWKNAIKKDGLNWPGHGSHLERMKDPVAIQYGVREIPTKYLIDEKGYIIATNPSFEEIDKILSEKLSK